MKKYNQLKAILAITKASLIATTRNPSSLVFGLLFPLIFIMVFGFVGNNSFSLDVAIHSQSDKNNPILKALEEVDSLDLIKDKSDEDNLTELKKGTIDAIIKIVKNADGQSPLYIVEIETSDASQNSGLFISIIDGILDKSNIAFAQIKQPAFTMNVTEIPGREYKYIDFILPGQLGFSLLSTGIFTTSFLFINLKQTLVIKRFFATPVSKLSIILGEGLARLIFAMIQAAIIILAGVGLFQYTLVNGLATFVTMLLIAGLGLIVFLGFGFIVSSIAKDENAVPSIANMLTLPQFLLAGTFFPISAFPEWLQPISRILPLTFLNEAMRKIAFEGGDISSIARELFALVIWGVVIYLIAIKIFKWE